MLFIYNSRNDLSPKKNTPGKEQKNTRDMFWTIATSVLTLSFVPPIAKPVLGYLFGSVLSFVGYQYLQFGLLIYYDVWLGKLYIENVRVKELFLKKFVKINAVLNCTECSLGCVQVSFSIWQAVLNPFNAIRNVQVFVDGVQVGLETTEEYLDSFEMERQKIVEGRIEMANQLTRQVEDIVNGKLAEQNGTSGLVKKLLGELVKGLKMKVCNVGGAVVHKTKSIGIYVNVVELEGKDKDQVDVFQSLSIDKVEVVVEDESLVCISNVSSRFVVPVLPWTKKQQVEALLDVSFGIESIVFGTSPTMLAVLVLLMSRLQEYGKFVNDIQFREQQECELADRGYEKTYLELYAVDTTKLRAAEMVMLNNIERKWSVKKMIAQRAIKLKWMDRWNVQPNIQDIQQKVQDTHAKHGFFEKMLFTLSVRALSVALREHGDTMVNFTLMESDISFEQTMPQDNHTKPTMHVEILSNRIGCIVECPSLGNSQSYLLRQRPNYRVLNLTVDQSSEEKINVVAALAGIQCIVVAAPVEFVCLYVERMITVSNIELLQSEQDMPVAVQDDANKHGNDDTDLRLFGKQNLSLKVDVDNIGLCIGKKMEQSSSFSVAYLLELAISANCNVHSDMDSESIKCVLSNIALMPRVIDWGDEDIDMIHDSIERSLLNPLEIHAEYSNSSSSACSIDQTIFLDVPDVFIGLSHSNFAILLGSLTDLSKIQVSTPESIQHAVEMKQHRKGIMDEVALKSKLEATKAVFSKIDTDNSGSIDVKELTTLLRQTAAGEDLLLSESVRIGRAIFDYIDTDHSGVISFDEFSDYVDLDHRNCRLKGFLNLKGGEYVDRYYAYDLFGVPPQEYHHLFTNTKVKEKFWQIYQHETGATEADLCGQQLVTVQKKVVRLLKNYVLAKQFWERLVSPSLMSRSQQYCPWILNPRDYCGGLCEFESISNLVVQGNTASSIVLNSTPENTEHASNAKGLCVTSNIKIGNIKVVLLDDSLPPEAYRAEFFVGDIVCHASLKSAEASDVKSLLSLPGSEWDATLGLKLHCLCYSDIVGAMESVIEPWNLVAAISGNKHEEGCSILVEADERFQLNLTNSVLHTARLILEMCTGKNVLDDGDHERALMNNSDKGFHATNYTGIDLIIGVGEEEQESILIAHNCSALFKFDHSMLESPSFDYAIPDFINVAIPGWGNAHNVEIGDAAMSEIKVYQDCNVPQDVKPFIPICCRRTTVPEKGCSFVLRSNVYIANQTSKPIEVNLNFHSHVLGEGNTSGNFEDVTLNLASKQREMLSLRIYTSSADVLISDGISKRIISIKPELLTKIWDSIVDESNVDASRNQVTYLAPDVHLTSRLSHTGQIEWDIVILPKLVVRNALPYAIDYRILEVDKDETKDIKSISNVCKALESHDAIKGSVNSGVDIEVPNLSKSLAYISFRIVKHDIKPNGNQVATGGKSIWSKPTIIFVSGEIEKFELTRKACFDDRTDENSKTSNPLTLEISGISLPGAPRLLKFSVPYWIINDTGKSLEYSTDSVTDESVRRDFPLSPKRKLQHQSSSFVELEAHFMNPRMAFLTNDRLSIRTKRINRSVQLTENPVSWKNLVQPVHTKGSLAEPNDEWSKLFNVSAINTSGELACGNHFYSFSISGMSGVFQGVKVIRFGPRYILKNNTGLPLKVKGFLADKSTSVNALKFLGVQARKLRMKRSTSMLQRIDSENQKHDHIGETMLSEGQNAMISSLQALNKNDTASNSATPFLIIRADDEHDDDLIPPCWSGAVSIASAGDLYVGVQDVRSGRHLLVQVSVQSVNEHVYITLNNASRHPPYRIENSTPCSVSYRRFLDDPSTIIEPGSWASFAWHNPIEHERTILLTFESSAKSPGTQCSFDIENIGYVKEIGVQANGRDYSVYAEVKPDGMTRTLKLSDQSAQEVIAYADRQRADEVKFLYASFVDIRFFGFGVSLFNAYPQEILFVSIDTCCIMKEAAKLEWGFSVFHAQVDNMLKKAKYPVILEPIGSGYDNAGLGEKRSPFLELKVESTLAQNVQGFSLFEFRLAPTSIKLDVDFILQLVSFFDSIILSDDSMHLYDSNRVIRELLSSPLPSPKYNDYGSAKDSLIYMETFRVHATAFELEWELNRKTFDNSDSYLAVQVLLNIIEVIGSSFSGSPTLRFNELLIHQCFSSKEQLVDQLVTSYTRQAIMQAYRVLGSSDILGDPIGIVENLGSGVAEFFRITKGEVLGDSSTRGEGVIVLGKTIAKTGASTMTKITGSLDRMVGNFNDNESTSKVKKSLESVDEDTPDSSFIENLGRQLTGIVRKPIDGAKKDGVSGFVKGTVKGILGPGVLCLKAVTSASHTLASGVQAQMVDRAPFQGRRRSPKSFVDGLLQAGSDTKPSLLKLNILRAQGLVANSSCDAECVVYLDSKEVFTTKVIHNTVNPKWNESKNIGLTGAEKVLRFAVKDSYGAMTSTIGDVQLPMVVALSDFKVTMQHSALKHWVYTGDRKVVENLNVGATKALQREYYLQSTKMNIGRKNIEKLLIVSIIEAKELRYESGIMNILATAPNPYVSLLIGNCKQKTTSKSATVSPIWDESFTFPLHHPHETTPVQSKPPVHIKLSCRSEGLMRNDTIGIATFDVSVSVLKSLELQGTLERWVSLSNRGLTSGHIRMKLELLDAQPSSNSGVHSRVGKLIVEGMWI